MIAHPNARSTRSPVQPPPVFTGYQLPAFGQSVMLDAFVHHNEPSCCELPLVLIPAQPLFGRLVRYAPVEYRS
jgi:hypothetical protein